MTRQSGYEHIYYYVLQGHLNILADERDKKILLDIVLGIQLADNFKLYAFCITNETVCLLLGGTGRTMINTGIRKVIAGFAAHRVKGKRMPKACRSGRWPIYRSGRWRRMITRRSRTSTRRGSVQ